MKTRTRGRLVITAVTATVLAFSATAANAAPRNDRAPVPGAEQLVVTDSSGRQTVMPATTFDRGQKKDHSSKRGSGRVAELGAEAVLSPELAPELLNLPDAGTISGAVGSEPANDMGASSVIGADERYRITATEQSPYVQIPQITMTRTDQNNEGYICTGWLFGNRTLATAAHCLTDGRGTVTAKNIKVVFGLNGRTAVAECGVSQSALPRSYMEGADPAFDWAILVLNCNAGNVFGHLGYRAQDTAPTEASWAVTGYPADKYEPAVGYTMWSHRGYISALDSFFWRYTIDTFGGQSGAPIYRLESGPCGNCAIGIHTYGVGGPGGSMNSGNRISPFVASSFATYASTFP